MPVVDNARQDAVPQIYTTENQNPGTNNSVVTIGVVRDSAFQFYYPDNIEAWKIWVPRLNSSVLYPNPTFPDVDAIYMGGGFS